MRRPTDLPGRPEKSVSPYATSHFSQSRTVALSKGNFCLEAPWASPERRRSRFGTVVCLYKGAPSLSLRVPPLRVVSLSLAFCPQTTCSGKTQPAFLRAQIENIYGGPLWSRHGGFSPRRLREKTRARARLRAHGATATPSRKLATDAHALCWRRCAYNATSMPVSYIRKRA